MFGHLVVSIFGPWGEIIAVLHRIILAHTLCRWIAKRVRQMSRKYYICFGFCSKVTDYFWQLCDISETRDRQGHKKRGVTKDVATWFDSPQTFLKTDERHRKCQSNSFRVTSLCKLHCCLKFQDDC